MALKIGEVAQAAGVNVETVRYYERRGLLEEPPRSSAGYRQYEAAAVDRIRFIQRAQGLGFRLREVEELLALRVEELEGCSQVKRRARAKRDEVRRKIRELGRLEEVLDELVAACEARSRTDACPILAALEVRTAERPGAPPAPKRTEGEPTA